MDIILSFKKYQTNQLMLQYNDLIYHQTDSINFRNLMRKHLNITTPISTYKMVFYILSCKLHKWFIDDMISSENSNLNYEKSCVILHNHEKRPVIHEMCENTIVSFINECLKLPKKYVISIFLIEGKKCYFAIIYGNIEECLIFKGNRTDFPKLKFLMHTNIVWQQNNLHISNHGVKSLTYQEVYDHIYLFHQQVFHTSK